jgi:hypothetical protein
MRERDKIGSLRIVQSAHVVAHSFDVLRAHQTLRIARLSGQFAGCCVCQRSKKVRISDFSG